MKKIFTSGQGDCLLIWLDEANDIVELVRLGSHSELFG